MSNRWNLQNRYKLRCFGKDPRYKESTFHKFHRQILLGRCSWSNCTGGFGENDQKLAFLTLKRAKMTCFERKMTKTTTNYLFLPESYISTKQTCSRRCRHTFHRSSKDLNDTVSQFRILNQSNRLCKNTRSQRSCWCRGSLHRWDMELSHMAPLFRSLFRHDECWGYFKESAK